MVCDNTFVLKALLFLSNIIEIVKIVVPIGLIILASIDLGKYMLNGADDSGKIKTSIFHRFLAAIIVFFVPTIVSVVFGLLGTFSPLLDSCRANANAATIKLLDQLAAENNPDDGDNDSDINNPKDLVVATWNIGGGRKHSGITTNLLGSKVKDINVDIIGMQEVRKNISYIQSINRYTDMDYLYHKASPAGIAILSKISISGQTAQKLVSCYEARYLLKTVIKVGDKNVSFYNVHASYQDCKTKQYADIYEKIKGDSNPTILVGDFNAASNCKALTDAFGSNYSLEAHAGTKCTDSIIISKNRGITLKSQRTIKTSDTLSDHNLVIATFTIQ